MSRLQTAMIMCLETRVCPLEYKVSFVFCPIQDFISFVDRMRLDDLPSELLLEIFSYIHPADLYITFLPLLDGRIRHLLTQLRVSLDLTCTSLSRLLLVKTCCCPSQIVFLRLTNAYTDGLLIRDFFSSKHFRFDQWHRLRSLHLDDVIGDELDYLPAHLEKLHVKFHKKAKHAVEFYRLALTSSSLKECYLIGGYAFDHQTCSPIGSLTIERLHMAIKSFPTDLFIVLQALPSLIKLKSKIFLVDRLIHVQLRLRSFLILARIYAQSLTSSLSLSHISLLRHINIDLQGCGISFNALYQQCLSHLSHLRSLIYHSYGKFSHDADDFTRLLRQLNRIQFVCKGLSSYTDMTLFQSQSNLVVAVQETTQHKNSRQSFLLHTIPYPDKMLYLPFIDWNYLSHTIDHRQQLYSEGIDLNVTFIELVLSFIFFNVRKKLSIS
jgi:hypothetical protein